MFENFFSFKGRINRLTYFVRLLSLAFTFGSLVGLGAVAGALREAPLLLLLLLAGLVVYVWGSLSLQARRIRDIGWNPVIIIPVWMLASAVDIAIATFQASARVGVPHESIVGAIGNGCMSLALLFWPGRPSDDAPSSSGAAWAPRTTPAASPAAPTLARAAAPVGRAPTPGAATTFGRRG
jgi:uncharacterized membrane protein YhaH (DUF805 family)